MHCYLTIQSYDSAYYVAKCTLTGSICIVQEFTDNKKALLYLSYPDACISHIALKQTMQLSPPHCPRSKIEDNTTLSKTTTSSSSSSSSSTTTTTTTTTNPYCYIWFKSNLDTMSLTQMGFRLMISGSQPSLMPKPTKLHRSTR